MRVRHKKTGAEFEIGCGYSPGNGRSYYQTLGGTLIDERDPDFEKVPTETWRDVTGEMILSRDGRTIFDGEQPIVFAHDDLKGYRLSVVQLFRYFPTGRILRPGDEHWDYQTKDAFIVEKRDNG
jgi:hypothetical protein